MSGRAPSLSRTSKYALDSRKDLFSQSSGSEDPFANVVIEPRGKDDKKKAAPVERVQPAVKTTTTTTTKATTKATTPTKTTSSKGEKKKVAKEIFSDDQVHHRALQADAAFSHLLSLKSSHWSVVESSKDSLFPFLLSVLHNDDDDDDGSGGGSFESDDYVTLCLQGRIAKVQSSLSLPQITAICGNWTLRRLWDPLLADKSSSSTLFPSDPTKILEYFSAKSLFESQSVQSMMCASVSDRMWMGTVSKRKTVDVVAIRGVSEGETRISWTSMMGTKKKSSSGDDEEDGDDDDDVEMGWNYVGGIQMCQSEVCEGYVITMIVKRNMGGWLSSGMSNTLSKQLMLQQWMALAHYTYKLHQWNANKKHGQKTAQQKEEEEEEEEDEEIISSTSSFRDYIESFLTIPLGDLA